MLPGFVKKYVRFLLFFSKDSLCIMNLLKNEIALNSVGLKDYDRAISLRRKKCFLS